MYIGGIFLLGAIGGLLFRQSRQRKKANAALQQLNTSLDQANQVKNRLFGVLSHDLRSPISNLVSFLNLQKDSPEFLEPHHVIRHQREITRSAANLLDTMEDLLLWSKEQMHHFSPQPRQIPIARVFEEMRSLYPDTGRYRLDFECPPELTLYADENYLKTILRNLTTNAIKAVAATSKGHIHWQATETTLSITDNGPGLPPEARAILENDAHETASNTLGLHLIRDFSAAIGFRIAIDSSPEEGTRITLSFSPHHRYPRPLHFADPSSS
jgi:signal transduction histidine kinase